MLKDKKNTYSNILYDKIYRIRMCLYFNNIRDPLLSNDCVCVHAYIHTYIYKLWSLIAL